MASLSQYPSGSGVYIFKNTAGEPIYIGKAINLRERIKQHSLSKEPKELLMAKELKTITCLETNSEFSALLLEANLIKKHQPKYNLVLRDDKQKLYIAITKERFAKVRLMRSQQLTKTPLLHYFGPFPSLKLAKTLLNRLRQVIPFCTEKRMGPKPCFYHQLGLCSPCPNYIVKQSTKKQLILQKKYQQNISRLLMVFAGNGDLVIKDFKKKLKQLSKKQQYEKAAVLRDQINYLTAIFQKQFVHLDKLDEPNYIFQLRLRQSRQLQSVLKLKKLERAECYDISNFNFKQPTASMVVFNKGQAQPQKYRRFKINGPARFDPEMLAEVLKRRLAHNDWPLPDLIVIDGGVPQLLKLKPFFKTKSPLPKLVGFAKDPDRLVTLTGRSYHLTNQPLALNYLQKMRDEAHRFAKKYHSYLRAKELKEIFSTYGKIKIK